MTTVKSRFTRYTHLYILLLIAALAVFGGCLHGDGLDETGTPDTPSDDDDDTGDDDDNDTTQPDDDDDIGDDDDDTGPDPITLDLIEGCNHFSTSEECFLPFPSSFFQIPDDVSPTGYRVNYPENTVPAQEGDPAVDMTPTNTADGASPSGPILVHFGVDINPEQLTRQRELEESLMQDNPIALFDLDTGKRVLFMSEMDMNRKEEYPGRYALIIRPLQAMEMGHRHVVVLTKDLTDEEGDTFESPEAFAVLRDDIPTTNEEIEEIRERYETIFTLLDDNGYPRNNILLAWDFMVASEEYLTGSVLSMREQALAEAATDSFSYTITRNDADPNANLARVVEGTFEVPTYLNEDNVFEYDENHHPVRQATNLSFPFTMIIPKKAQTEGQPLPLVIFGHGLFGSGRSYLAGWGMNTFSQIAEDAGMILLATDWIGLSDGDLTLILTEVLPNINRLGLVTDRLQQSLINNLILTEIGLGDLGSDPAIQVGAHDLIDTNKVYYYGVSLGGIQGSSFVSISNRFTRGVLAVPGSVWFNMFPRSIHWNLIKPLMEIYFPDPLVQQFGVSFIQARFDHSDPINLTKLLYRSPPPGVPARRTVLLQEAIGDSQVPNLATEMLARTIGVKLMTPSVYDVTGMETTTSPETDSTLVQIYMQEQVEQNPPPEENVPPDTGNNAHSDILYLPHVLEQTTHFMHTGVITQDCDGACNPN